VSDNAIALLFDLILLSHYGPGVYSTSNVVPTPPILVTLMMEAIRSAETFVLKERHGVTSQTTAFFRIPRMFLGEGGV
jgi:hypothetical protein